MLGAKATPWPTTRRFLKPGDAAVVEWLPCSRSLLPSYLAFAAETFGPKTHQSQPRYVEWLYEANPAGASLEDLLVAVAGGEVVGCFHRTKLPWQVGARSQPVLEKGTVPICSADSANSGQSPTIVPAVHDLMVHPRFRGGLGAMLILSAFAGLNHALLPGVGEPLASAYARMGCEPIEMRWYHRVLRPIAGAARLGMERFGGPIQRAVPLRPIRVESLTAVPPSKIYTSPSLVILQRTADALNARRGDRPGPCWTTELLRWRCFHPLGPQHFLVEQLHGSATTQAIFSLGPRRGLAVGRLIAHTATSVDALQSLLQVGAQSLRRAGAHVLLVASADPVVQESAAAARLRRIADEPKTFLYHRARATRFGPTAVQAIAGDLGYEALCWRS